jgi:hypothetical protein
MTVSPGDKMKAAQAPISIRGQTHCSRACPAFTKCPLVPLAIQPEDPKDRICLVNHADPELKRAYEALFVGGHSAIIEEIQRSIMEYGEILRASKKQLTAGQQLRYKKDLNMMLIQLLKYLPKEGGEGRKNEPERVEIDSGNTSVQEDPESLRYSEKLREILPSMIPIAPLNLPSLIEQKSELSALKKFFNDEPEEKKTV